MDEKKLPKGRLGRLARIAGVGARTAGTLLRGKEADRSAAKTAAVLGQLRGLATKVGQMASYVDGVVPPQHRDAYEKSMGKLQAATPTSAPAAIRALVERELDAPIDTLYAEWDETPIASASIGQVHKARLHDGRAVAVKVQHPGIAEALESDLRNAGLIEMALAPLGMRRFDSKRMLEEIRTRFREELDYGLEATRQQLFFERLQGEPHIRIPEVVAERSGHRVLTTTFAEGMPFSEARAADPEQRRAWAETLWRFVYRSNLVFGLFNADPHPGNYLFGPDGQVTFLDFGCVQQLTEEHRINAVRMHQAAHEQDERGFREGARALLMLQGGRYEEMAVAYSNDCFRPILHSPFRITRDYCGELVDGFKELIGVMRKATQGDALVPLPDGMLFINRLQFGFYSVLARLDAEVDYRAVEGPIVAEALAR